MSHPADRSFVFINSFFFSSNVTKILCWFLFAYQSSGCTNPGHGQRGRQCNGEREGRENAAAWGSCWPGGRLEEQPASPSAWLQAWRWAETANPESKCQGEEGRLRVNPTPAPWCCSSGWFGKVPVLYSLGGQG